MIEYSINNENIVYSVASYDKMDYFSLKKHIHPFCEFLYLTSGEISYVIENKEYRIKKGELLLIDSAKFHFVKNIITPPYKRVCFQFMGDLLPNKTLLKNILDKEPLFVLPESSPIPGLLDLIPSAKQNLPSEHFDTVTKSVLSLILTSLYNLNNAGIPPKHNLSKNCENILSYINENIVSINSIEQIANKFFFSKSYISHVFKKEMQVGIIQYIRNKKIIMADELLKSGKRPTEVAKECGYENYISFYRTYCSFFNRPPSLTKPTELEMKPKRKNSAKTTKKQP